MNKDYFRFIFSFFLSSVLFLAPFVCPGQDAGNKSAVLKEPGKSCAEDLREADYRCQKGQCGEAVTFYDRLLGKESSCPRDLIGEAFFGRGMAKEALQDFRGAVSDYRMALQANPDSRKFREGLGKGYYRLANQKERLGDFRGALADYLTALEFIPDSREATDGIAGLYFERGRGKHERGELKGAMEDYKKALQYRPNYPEVREAKKNLDERMQHKATERDGMFMF
jgi:tetratricopeptide (TPR) repeat protein